LTEYGLLLVLFGWASSQAAIASQLVKVCPLLPLLLPLGLPGPVGSLGPVGPSPPKPESQAAIDKAIAARRTMTQSFLLCVPKSFNVFLTLEAPLRLCRYAT
jgi:hypothetical protein